MHLFTSISLVSLLLFTCFGSLASRPDASLRIKRDVDVTGDVLIEQDGAANVMEIQSDQQISNLELNQMISEHSHLHQESPGQSKSSELESHYSQHYNSKSGSLRGLRCGPELFTRHNLQEAANKGCELLKKKKKTFGFKRYPSRYEGSLDEPHSTFSEENSPEGPFYIYPVLKNEKIYSFGMVVTPSILSLEINDLIYRPLGSL